MEKEQYLLSQIQTLVDHEKELRKLKGEDFNIFLITKKTSNEQFTHSAFIAELLNPKGSHHKGDIFLKAFIETIGESISEQNQPERVKRVFEEYRSNERIDKTRVFKEKYIGPKIIDKSNCGRSTGGYIDILLKLNGYSISIENKIDAGLQEKQIERYSNYNKSKNIVFYLTKQGKEAEENSVIIEEDYYCISHKDEIDEWLNKCFSLSASQPILRESIRQYQLLIQKITGKMEESEKLSNLLLDNIEAADSLNKNFYGALNIIKDKFREEVKDRLENKLGKEFSIKEIASIDNKHARIRIEYLMAKKDGKVVFQIESFSGVGHPHREGKIYGGIYVLGGDEVLAKEINKESINYWWPLEVCLYEDSLRDTSILIKFHNDKEYRENAISSIVDKMTTLIEENKHKV